jgi:SAM-dependent methyltransferase
MAKQFPSIYDHPEIFYAIEEIDDKSSGGTRDAVYADFLWAVHLLERYSPHQVESVLEACCGNAPHGRFFAKHGYHVTAFDYSAAMVRAAQEAAQKEGVEIALFQRNSQSFEVPGGPFDAAVCLAETPPAGFTASDCREFDRNAISHLKSAANVLRPGAIYLQDWGYHLEQDKKRTLEYSVWDEETFEIPGATVLRRYASPADDFLGNMHTSIAEYEVEFDDGRRLHTRDVWREPLLYSIPHYAAVCEASGCFKYLDAYSQGEEGPTVTDLGMPTWLVLQRL